MLHYTLRALGCQTNCITTLCTETQGGTIGGLGRYKLISTVPNWYIPSLDVSGPLIGIFFYISDQASFHRI